ncbi:disulfide bond formation protein DsbA [Streptomyces sp. CB02923]|uniref:mycothiol-dependent nitroreductase Rv2466c family protein n=1 Tax=Streptomyces sp. CB02923 TaxID=1718985 RepID=UPI00093FAA38|nr:disulfide bond formation protein DsbA [Streptomyces sp. CB02923]OKI09263.1 disulfide bond formation protein DsbA [Streptomyces sp. CB02923]
MDGEAGAAVSGRGVTADFWFDPVCPYTWVAAQWIREVARVRPVRVRLRLMSLQVLNEDREVNPEDPDGEWGAYLWAPVRACAAVEQRYGQEALGRFYRTLGTWLHHRGEWDGIERALSDAGLPREVAAAAWTTEYDTVIRASHARAVALVGADVGTPVIAVGGTAFFGPVVSPAPRGEAAGRLWDGALLMASVPGFYELRRPAAAEPDFGPAPAAESAAPE